MELDRSLNRRTVLAALGTAAIPAGTTVTAQERDPTAYDRPRTIVENDTEVTLQDCSRTIIDGDPTRIDEIEVHVMYQRYGDRSRTYLTVLDDILTVLEFDLPVDINVNAHIDDFDPPGGSVIINSVHVNDSAGETVVTHNWPQNEWDCQEIKERDLDPEAAREFAPIEYTYETYIG